MTTLAVFNNKGGVGKTSITWHLSYALARLDVPVLVVDADPQANLTATFFEDDTVEAIWQSDQTVYGMVEPVIRGLGDPVLLPCFVDGLCGARSRPAFLSFYQVLEHEVGGQRGFDSDLASLTRLLQDANLYHDRAPAPHGNTQSADPREKRQDYLTRRCGIKRRNSSSSYNPAVLTRRARKRH